MNGFPKQNAQQIQAFTMPVIFEKSTQHVGVFQNGGENLKRPYRAQKEN